jgi:diaminopropionate ammonia-lyase
MQTFVNPAARRDGTYAGLFTADEYRDVEAFYSQRPALAPSPLRALPALASSLGLGRLFIKDESGRFGLEAFKVVGVTYAMHKLGRERLTRGVVCATAGNHGRAVARAARDAEIRCMVFVPSPSAGASEQELAVRSSRVNAMRNDGARVVDVAGTYEEAVAQATSHARDHGTVLLSDTAPTTTDVIARSIMLGYTHIFSEASTEWTAPPDLVLVQGGVGGLVAAAASWFAFHQGGSRPTLIACEPENADCLLESARAGHAVDLTAMGDGAMGNRMRRPTDGQLLTTIMAGLRCATPSAAAWPAVRDGIDAFVSIPDSAAIDAITRLAQPAPGDPPIEAGPSGACGVAALVALCTGARSSALGQLGRLDRSTTVMAIVTEGA